MTICFADLDGADGLWVPEERTILVNRGLPDDRVPEVIEHELAHVMIDDQHADLDAGKEVQVGGPPARYRQPRTVALAAVSLFVVIGGATYGVSAARDGTNRVAPNPDGPGLTAQESGEPKPKPSLSPSPVPGGGTVDVTVYVTPPKPSVTGSPKDPGRPSPTATTPIPSATAPHTTGGAPSREPSRISPTPSVLPPTSEPPVEPSPTSDPPSVVPTPPDQTGGADEGTGGGTGDTGGVGDGIDTVPAGTVSVPPLPTP